MILQALFPHLLEYRPFRVARILHDPAGSGSTPPGVQVLQGGECSANRQTSPGHGVQSGYQYSQYTTVSVLTAHWDARSSWPGVAQLLLVSLSLSLSVSLSGFAAGASLACLLCVARNTASRPGTWWLETEGPHSSAPSSPPPLAGRAQWRAGALCSLGCDWDALWRKLNLDASDVDGVKELFYLSVRSNSSLRHLSVLSLCSLGPFYLFISVCVIWSCINVKFGGKTLGHHQIFFVGVDRWGH